MKQNMSYKEKGILILEKSKNGVVHIAYGRFLIIAISFILQILLLYHIFTWLGSYLHYVYGGIVIAQFIFMIYLLNINMNATAKMSWFILFMIAPVIGIFLYVFNALDIGHHAAKERLKVLKEDTKVCMPDNTALLETIKVQDKTLYNLAWYLKQEGHFNIYNQTKVTYFPLGEDKFEEMLKQLSQAKEFIFMEYFIIEEGYMWGSILNILAEKVKQGVEVRVMYDGTCEFSKLPHNYPKRLKELGIECKVFLPVTPFASTLYNYRDHRKILVIDGKVAFNGGINLADEYINKRVIFGHWKDTALMLEGPAVASYTMMFLQMWHLDEKEQEDYTKWIVKDPIQYDVPGYVLPYGSDPIDGEHVGEMVYIDMINHARNYFYMTTPYLILDGEMEKALVLAAKRGVDVRLILPHIPDKKYAFALAQTHYKVLLEAGVKIYEYTPGFVHAKTLICDNFKAIVGTINLDYRSLYHHFECATYLYSMPEIFKIRDDIEALIEISQEMTLENYKQGRFQLRLMGKLLKIIAPLM